MQKNIQKSVLFKIFLYDKILKNIGEDTYEIYIVECKWIKKLYS